MQYESPQAYGKMEEEARANSARRFWISLAILIVLIILAQYFH